MPASKLFSERFIETMFYAWQARWISFIIGKNETGTINEVCGKTHTL
jgi:hypothetical protein